MMYWIKRLPNPNLNLLVIDKYKIDIVEIAMKHFLISVNIWLISYILSSPYNAFRPLCIGPNKTAESTL